MWLIIGFKREIGLIQTGPRLWLNRLIVHCITHTHAHGWEGSAAVENHPLWISRRETESIQFNLLWRVDCFLAAESMAAQRDTKMRPYLLCCCETKSRHFACVSSADSPSDYLAFCCACRDGIIHKVHRTSFHVPSHWLPALGIRTQPWPCPGWVRPHVRGNVPFWPGEPQCHLKISWKLSALYSVRNITMARITDS